MEIFYNLYNFPKINTMIFDNNYHMMPAMITRRINSLDCSILMLFLLMRSEKEQDDVTTWEEFPYYWFIWEGIPPVTN